MQSGRIKVLGLPIKIAIAVIIIGTALKILHFQIAALIMTIGFSTVLVLYAIRFYKKTNKTWNDSLKLVFVGA
jgi:ABC-type transport system involved in cytochrome bd biosynthesis fused ATPase/permease subunit